MNPENGGRIIIFRCLQKHVWRLTIQSKLVQWQLSVHIPIACTMLPQGRKKVKGICTTIFSTLDVIQSASDRGNKVTMQCAEGSSGSLVSLQAQCLYPEGAENIWNQQPDLLGLWQQVCIFLVQHVKLKKIGKATWDKRFDLTVPCYSDEILQALSSFLFPVNICQEQYLLLYLGLVLFMYMFCYTLAEEVVNISCL